MPCRLVYYGWRLAEELQGEPRLLGIGPIAYSAQDWVTVGFYMCCWYHFRYWPSPVSSKSGCAIVGPPVGSPCVLNASRVIQ
jgi:hypothetical protein